ncbi:MULTISPECIES: DUF4006 family protein [unclassified Campylobacter]|uniref:DUF4006 family protein n=1 Tax=unclassified Campylobacter TaxID=2593542 RepID=UPI00123833F2|nr:MULTISPECIES: DUF4006 family protein [unclassified Campylobacter]KAA6224602.1 DUF4006 family protein [Campylobacter sp. LR185c]KAA6224844.1 DUF4006 family protein [Campylobacter sp. LR286c]KAA6227991.1 DUF4006 family protein [Campylobacter sp. LR196d]KAA6233472.1 DUF4006 family protein [Campylobacter sp. LR291e]KAA6234409.1 DUF4006 family protein [Campylobacter sp. LR264d]
MENSSRCVFALNGLTGMLIAVVLLLSILVGLTCWGISAQQSVMQAPYTLQNKQDIKMFGSSRNDHVIIKGETK